jgi:uncharacterized membrane protein
LIQRNADQNHQNNRKTKSPVNFNRWILSRLQPNLLDLGVAIVSGIAAAYAHARESIQKSLPGVAVAVALVPPACVMGVGIGWLDWSIISGAGLLFLTNLIP